MERCGDGVRGLAGCIEEKSVRGKHQFTDQVHSDIYCSMTVKYVALNKKTKTALQISACDEKLVYLVKGCRTGIYKNHPYCCIAIKSEMQCTQLMKIKTALETNRKDILLISQTSEFNAKKLLPLISEALARL